jgi:DNA/RNA endonuclease G (NUC1)
VHRVWGFDFPSHKAEPAGHLLTITFIMPPEKASSHKPAEFAKSIREVELCTGLNFFSSLPQAEQDEIELPIHTSL